MIGQPLSDRLMGAQGVVRSAPVGRPGETEVEANTNVQLASCFQARPPACQEQARTTQRSVQLADPSRLLRGDACQSLGNPHYAADT